MAASRQIPSALSRSGGSIGHTAVAFVTTGQDMFPRAGGVRWISKRGGRIYARVPGTPRALPGGPPNGKSIFHDP